jgi:hypothetical protein
MFIRKDGTVAGSVNYANLPEKLRTKLQPAVPEPVSVEVPSLDTELTVTSVTAHEEPVHEQPQEPVKRPPGRPPGLKTEKG